MNREYIVIAFTENQIGVLNRITVCYLRRKINIESLKVSESSIKGISMFVISAFTTQEIIDKVTKQIRNIIDVIDVSYYTPDELITQEIALYKISAKYLGGNGRIDAFSRGMMARMIEFNPSYVVMEKTGTREEIDELRDKLDREGVLLEFTRSGSVVLHRDAIEDILQEKIDEFDGEGY
ncbi:MAG: acetolactate synthase small subunit [Rikenellaceae bacterium]|nr:acetolactate synthase small subunit [Rikenellaceae bacterium]